MGLFKNIAGKSKSIWSSIASSVGNGVIYGVHTGTTLGILAGIAVTLATGGAALPILIHFAAIGTITGTLTGGLLGGFFGIMKNRKDTEEQIASEPAPTTKTITSPALQEKAPPQPAIAPVVQLQPQQAQGGNFQDKVAQQRTAAPTPGTAYGRASG